MKSVSHSEWLKKAEGLAEWRKNRKTPPSLDIYRKIVGMVHVGLNVADIGAGQCHLAKCLEPHRHVYYPFDPFPLNDSVICATAENFTIPSLGKYHTVFMLAALDNVQNVEQALRGLQNAATENIVILTGIDIPTYPDEAHTHRITRKDLIEVLGEPFQEVEMLPRVWLYEWRI